MENLNDEPLIQNESSSLSRSQDLSGVDSNDEKTGYVELMKKTINIGTKRVLGEFLTFNIVKNVKKHLYLLLENEIKSVNNKQTIDKQCLELYHQKVTFIYFLYLFYSIYIFCY